MYSQIPVPAPIEAPFTPEKLLALAAEYDAKYQELSVQFPAGTIHDGRNNARFMRECALGCAQWMEQGGHKELNVVGPFIGFALPKRGDRVRIKRGAVIHSTDSNVPRDGMVSQRARVVTVRDADAGFFDEHAFRMRGRTDDPLLRQPQVRWSGTNQYWCWTELTNVELIEETVEAG